MSQRRSLPALPQDVSSRRAAPFPRKIAPNNPWVWKNLRQRIQPKCCPENSRHLVADGVPAAAAAILGTGSLEFAAKLRQQCVAMVPFGAVPAHAKTALEQERCRAAGARAVAATATACLDVLHAAAS